MEVNIRQVAFAAILCSAPIANLVSQRSELWTHLDSSYLASVVGGCNVDGSNDCPDNSADCGDTACEQGSSGGYTCPSGSEQVEQVQESFDDVTSSETDEGKEDKEDQEEISCTKYRSCKSGSGSCAYADGGYKCLDGTGNWGQRNKRTPTVPDGETCNDG